MLTEPRDALAEQSSFVSYLVGLASLARVVHALASDGNRRAGDTREPDDFVYLLLGLARVGQSIEQLAKSVPHQGNPEPAAQPPTETRWLR
jgi:hypothetical protein